MRRRPPPSSRSPRRPARPPPVEAERHYTRALALLRGGRGAPGAALAGRGRVRHRLQRFRESLGGSPPRERWPRPAGARPGVDLLLEEATVRDWMEDVEARRRARERRWSASSRWTIRACRCGARWPGPAARAQGEWEAAARVLASAVEGAEAGAGPETQVVALALLGCGADLPGAGGGGRRALRRGARARCEEAGDALHLAATCINRVLLWLKLGDVGGWRRICAGPSCAGARAGPRPGGAVATFNLAEVLYVQGRPGGGAAAGAPRA